MSQVLDDLRAGKNIVVTQRNKPDLLLSGSVQSSRTSVQGTEGNVDGAGIVLSSNFVDVAIQLSKQLNEFARRPEVVDAMKRTSHLVGALDQKIKTFEQAFKITNERHADVIKKLEDK